jgi:hypothetical protein
MSLIFKITAKSKQPPTERRFAQSGHPASVVLDVVRHEAAKKSVQIQNEESSVLEVNEGVNVSP